MSTTWFFGNKATCRRSQQKHTLVRRSRCSQAIVAPVASTLWMIVFSMQLFGRPSRSPRRVGCSRPCAASEASQAWLGDDRKHGGGYEGEGSRCSLLTQLKQLPAIAAISHTIGTSRDPGCLEACGSQTASCYPYRPLQIHSMSTQHVR